MIDALDGDEMQDMELSIHWGYLPGCIGKVAEMHARFYSRHAGFGVFFESKVAREMAEFCERYDAERDGLWLALSRGSIEGSVAVDGLNAGEEGAHLRWFIASDAIRGSGAGNMLLRAALDFCRAKGYGSMHLWTFEGLDAARHLYEKHGFRLVLQRRGRQWGKEVNEQRFELELP